MSLTYHPSKNALTIGVLKAKNLKAKDINGKSGKGQGNINEREVVQSGVQQTDKCHLLMSYFPSSIEHITIDF